MSIDVARLKAEHAISSIAHRYTKLVRDGDEWKGLCPFHKERSPSFSVNDTKGVGYCFGCGWQGDVIALVQDAHHVDFKEACEILGGEKIAPVAYKPASEAEETPDIYGALATLPTPPEALPRPGETLRCWNPKRGRFTTYRPSMVFPYRDAAGAIIGVVVRVDLDDGKKLTPTLRWVKLPELDAPLWSHMPFDQPRPLYGLDQLARLLGEVLWCEGEKATDACRRLLGRCVVTTPGGGKSLHLVDWSSLKGRAVLFWGDADEEGERTVLGYWDKRGDWRPGAAELAHAAGAGPIRYVPWDKTKPKGWDAADAEAEKMLPAAILQFADTRAKKWKPGDRPAPPKPEKAPAVKDAAGEKSGTPDAPPRQPPPPHPFRILGYNHGVFYFHPRGAQQIVAYSPAQMTVQNLFMLAPLDHWEKCHPKRGGYDVVRTADSLVNAGIAAGIFDHERLRGRGAWIDNKRPVVHTGTSIIADGKTYRPSEFKSDFIYELSSPLQIDIGEPATKAEAHRLVLLCERLLWERTLSSALFVGWCVIAAVCGALPWRPHIWIRGPAGSGKTTAVDHILARMLGAFAIRRDGSTTEAHLRQILFHDARPVIIDEAETEDKAAAQRMQQVLQLVRIAASGGSIGKGGKSAADAVEYVVRACFCFSSINPSVTHYADESRISQLALRRYDTGDGADATGYFTALRRDLEALVTPEYAAKMLARTIKLLPVLLENVRIFTAAAAQVFQNQRAADQIGTLLAGYYLCHNDQPVSFDSAVAWIKTHEWSDHTAMQSTTDELKLLATIATNVRKTTTADGLRDYTVGQMINAALGREPQDGVHLMAGTARAELGKIGIGFERNDQSHFIVANNSPELARILRDTPWEKSWSGTLLSLEGAHKTAKAKFFHPGLNQRGVIVPAFHLGAADQDSPKL